MVPISGAYFGRVGGGDKTRYRGVLGSPGTVRVGSVFDAELRHACETFL